MTLTIKKLQLHNFRNYDDFALSQIEPITVLVGPNAIGKTNIIEGIELLSEHSTFRRARVNQLIKQGSQNAYLQAYISDDNRQLNLELVLEGQSKHFSLNGKRKKMTDLKGLIPSVIFTPDDLHIVKGAMGKRRQTLDTLGSQISPNYHVVRRDYEKIHRYKNHLLKEEPNPELLEGINEVFITCATQLTWYRFALFKRLMTPLSQLYEDISHRNERLNATYVPSWGKESIEDMTRDEVRDAITQALALNHDKELNAQRSIVGPHGDAITFFIDGMDATLFGSQGQQRSIVLSEKLAEAAVIESVLDQKPILLLDDVMSELDKARRQALMEYVATNVQTFITTANLEYFDETMLESAKIISLTSHKE